LIASKAKKFFFHLLIIRFEKNKLKIKRIKNIKIGTLDIFGVKKEITLQKKIFDAKNIDKKFPLERQKIHNASKKKVWIKIPRIQNKNPPS
tara:strand:- start:51 stop:323 length:273 start_codon:yes stop_codon:yes gene_type:complete